MRTFLLPVILLASSLLWDLHSAPLAAQAPPDAEPPLFVDRVDVNVINVEVVVTDKSGERVEGLTKEDFTLTEDGEPVEITNFYASLRSGRFPLTEGIEPLAPVEEPIRRRELPPDQRMHLVVYVDHFNMRAANRARFLEDLPAFLEQRLVQGDRIMMVGYNGSVDVVQPFTRDRALIRQAIDGMEKVATRREMDAAERQRIVRMMIVARAQVPPDLASAHQQVRSYVQETRHHLGSSAKALRAVVRTLAGLPGRKALLYVSDGLPRRPGEDLYQQLVNIFSLDDIQSLGDSRGIDPTIESLREDEGHLFDNIVRDANAHQVTLYTMDTRGSGGESSLSAAWAELGAGNVGHTMIDSMRTQNMQEPLIEMADATGGEATLSTNAFGKALERTADDFDSFYSLGYRSESGGDGAYRKLKVKVRYPGLTVRHRQGFIDKPEKERVGDRTVASLLLDLGDNPMGINVDLGNPRKDKRKVYMMPLLVRVPIDQLALLPSEDKMQGQLRFFVVVKDSKDGISELYDEAFPVSIPAEQFEQAKGQEIGWSTNLRVRSGTPTVAIGVWDEVSGVESFVHRVVRVGDS